MRLQHVTWQDVEQYLTRDDRLILPLGSTEQHGPRAVLGTDAIIPAALAERVAERTGTLAAPPVNYGMALHHLAFAGTLSLRPTTLIAVLKDLLMSAARHGFRRILVLNGHGGNVAAAQAALAEALHELPMLRVRFHSWWDPPEVQAFLGQLLGEPDGMHATPGETSMVMHLVPGVVKEMQGLAVKNLPHDYYLGAADWRRLTPSGVFNADPDLASAERGGRLFEFCVEHFCRVIETA
jgi:creatinine amidohydrolase